MKIWLGLATLLVSSPAWSNISVTRGYEGIFTIKVTSGGYGIYDPFPAREFSQVGQTATLRWSTITRTNVPSPARPSETLPVLRTNGAGIDLPMPSSFPYSSYSTNDPFNDNGRAFIGATYAGDETAGDFAVYFNSNSGIDNAVSFKFTMVDGQASGTGAASVFDDGWRTVSGRIGYDIIGGSAYAVVPEPQSWALMICGFGAIGAIGRKVRAPRAANA